MDDTEKQAVEKRVKRSSLFQEFFRGSGKEVLDEINKWAGMDNDTFKMDPYEHAYHAGRRSVAIFIDNVINQDVKEAMDYLERGKQDARHV